jgi:hypothetical protein
MNHWERAVQRHQARQQVRHALTDRQDLLRFGLFMLAVVIGLVATVVLT